METVEATVETASNANSRVVMEAMRMPLAPLAVAADNRVMARTKSAKPTVEGRLSTVEPSDPRRTSYYIAGIGRATS